MTDNQPAETQPEAEPFTILVEWPKPPKGIQPASRDPIEALQEQSDRAIRAAMRTMQGMAYRVVGTLAKLEEIARPDEAEVEFGINLDAEAGAVLAKASAGAQLTVKMKWVNQPPKPAPAASANR
jgi:hypothetical protein